MMRPPSANRWVMTCGRLVPESSVCTWYVLPLWATLLLWPTRGPLCGMGVAHVVPQRRPSTVPTTATMTSPAASACRVSADEPPAALTVGTEQGSLQAPIEIRRALRPLDAAHDLVGDALADALVDHRLAFGRPRLAD